MQAITPFNNSSSSHATASRDTRSTIDPFSLPDTRIKEFYRVVHATLTPVFNVAAPANLVGAPNPKVGFADGQGDTLFKTADSYTKEPGANPIGIPTVTPRPGFDFLGWYTAPTGGPQVADVTDTSFSPAPPGTIDACWVPNNTIVFNVNVGFMLTRSRRRIDGA